MKTAYIDLRAYTIATNPVTGETLSSRYDVFTIGAGYLNIAASLASSETADASAKSAKAVFDAAMANVYAVFDSSVVWSASAVWGTSGRRLRDLPVRRRHVSGLGKLCGFGGATSQAVSAASGTSVTRGTTDPVPAGSRKMVIQSKNWKAS